MTDIIDVCELMIFWSYVSFYLLKLLKISLYSVFYNDIIFDNFKIYKNKLKLTIDLNHYWLDIFVYITS